MVQESSERRNCSKTTPILYFVLESLGVILLVYIITGGDIFSRLGLILSIGGMVYPVYKLPTFLKRVDQCRHYLKMQQKKESKGY